MNLKVVNLTAIALAALTAPAFAHHSFAMFDPDQTITKAGTVKEFEWTNPHVWIQLMVDENGQIVEYSIEAGSPNTLVRRGWTSKSVKPGDRITVTINPLREQGRKGGSFVKAVLPDGSTLAQG